METERDLSALLDAGRRIADVVGRGCDDVEVFLTREASCVCAVVGDEMPPPEMRVGGVEVGVRALRGGRLAMSATTSLGVEDNLAAIEAALGVAGAAAIDSFSAVRTERDHAID